jgi:hypothetical protein
MLNPIWVFLVPADKF